MNSDVNFIEKFMGVLQQFSKELTVINYNNDIISRKYVSFISTGIGNKQHIRTY